MMQLQTTQTQKTEYILGHTGNELARLMHQARYYGDLTEHVFRLAGLKPGMRVLDVGCGAGDVSFLAASLVGPEGEVIGVDQSPEAVALASKRAAKAGLNNVHFLTHDLAGLNLDEPADALVGRMVLMHLDEPGAVLRGLVQSLKPDGLVVFQEMDTAGTKSEPACDLFETTLDWLRQTFLQTGADIQAGLRLPQIYQEAGLPRPEMIQGARVESGPDALIYHTIAQLVRSVLPVMERTGVTTAAEVEIDTLADRLRQEAVARNATLVSPLFIGAWSRKNGAAG